MKKNKNIFLKDPEHHDYAAAADYLELLYSKEKARDLANALEQSETIVKKAKDIYRASGLPLLSQKNKNVVKNIEKFKEEKKLSPILLVRGNEKLIIADGYHRLCASYYLTEDLEIRCRLV